MPSTDVLMEDGVSPTFAECEMTRHLSISNMSGPIKPGAGSFILTTFFQAFIRSAHVVFFAEEGVISVYSRDRGGELSCSTQRVASGQKIGVVWVLCCADISWVPFPVKL